jgi:DNA-binding response OmpR family regulator
MAKVLLVEDSDGLRGVMRLGLQAAGFDVDEAPDGRQALELQRRSPADVVVTDLFMPEMDGIEIIEALRQEFPDTGVVAISGVESKTGTDFLEVASEIGANRVLRKPFGISELVDAVRGALRH